ncbi:MAG: DnaB-like helicase C-terminal domain-containing protein [Sulfuriferula sp.]|nr:DnaB-like helicase C-terminal domain-containing protein [Sulfuriferula sp.]
MDHKLLLTTGITLLYLESQLETKTDGSAGLVRRVILDAKLPEVSIGLDHSREILQALKNTAVWMCDQPADHEHEPEEVLMRLKVDTKDDVDLYNAFESFMTPDYTQSKIKKLILNKKKQIHDHFREVELASIIKDMSSTFSFRRDSISDLRQFVAETIAKLDPFQVDAIIRDPAIVSDVDFSNIASVEKVFESVKETDMGLGVMRTGYQGINRMLQGGFRRGEEWVVGALQHKFKTGFNLSVEETVALYNVPYMLDATKKPMLVRFTFEDTAEQNMRFIFEHLYENETGQKCTKEFMKSMSKEDIAQFVMTRLQATGYTFRVFHVDPTQWTYQHLTNKLVELEAEGYEIHMCVVDYLALLNRKGLGVGGAIGDDIRELFRRMKNFCTPRKICLLTPHQLSSEAMNLVRQGTSDFVKEIAEKNYWDGCKRLSQEVDGELYIHIEKVNKQSYLTIMRGKHRGMPVLDEIDKYLVLEMHRVGGLRPDINGPDSSLRKVGGGPVGSGEEFPFWADMPKEMMAAA